MAKSKYKNKYFDKIPNAANKPNNNQSKLLFSLMPFQAYKIDNDQNGNWHMLTLNSGVVKL